MCSYFLPTITRLCRENEWEFIEQDISQIDLIEYNITQTPTMMVHSNGKWKGNIVGVSRTQTILSAVERMAS